MVSSMIFVAGHSASSITEALMIWECSLQALDVWSNDRLDWGYGGTCGHWSAKCLTTFAKQTSM
jgi:hypothetical protein